MPTFTIVCRETVWGSVQVEAPTLIEATAKLHEDNAVWPTFDGKGPYGSVETDVDHDLTIEANQSPAEKLGCYMEGTYVGGCDMAVQEE